MTLKEQIGKDFLVAYKAKEMEKKNFLSVVKGTIDTQAGKGVEPTDENVLKVIKSLEKSINENITQRTKEGLDTAEQVLELSYLEPYKPEEMSEDEIKVIVTELVGREGIKLNAGFLMGTFNKENRGGKPFDNNIVKNLIGEALV